MLLHENGVFLSYAEKIFIHGDVCSGKWSYCVKKFISYGGNFLDYWKEENSKKPPNKTSSKAFSLQLCFQSKLGTISRDEQK